MPPITAVDNEYITLQYLPDKKIIYHVIHKPIPHEPLVEALNAGTEALIKYKACKYWGPLTIKAGWKYWANVVPEALVAAGALAPVMAAYFEIGLRMQVFTSVESATQWLDSKQG